MALGYLLEWEAISAEAFSRLVQAAEWQVGVLDGQVVYDRAANGRVMAIGAWETPAAFNHFYACQLLAALHEAGLPEPTISSWAIPDACRVSAPRQIATIPLRSMLHFDPHAGIISQSGEPN